MKKKIIHQFTVKVKKEVEQNSTEEVKDEETGETKEVTKTETVTEAVPHDIIIYEPSRRQIEDADMEFSVEISKCIKRGILTKAMLAKKYSDSGGLLTEEDSNSLMRLYRELSETQDSLARLKVKKEKTDKDKEREGSLTESFADLRKEIVDLETTYQTVFNHTADTKAQNKTILWYMLNLSYVKSGDSEPVPLFEGSNDEQKQDSYYIMDEKGDDIFDLAKEKLMTFVSFWYFSQNPTKEDFDNLEKDIEEGNI